MTDLSKYQRACIVIMDGTPPGHDPGERPWLGCGPDSVFGAPEPEKERISREASQASVLMSKATDEQMRLLQRLALAAPARKLRFPSIVTLKQFLKATSDAERTALTDEELGRLWDGLAAATSAPKDYAFVTEQEVDYGGGRVRMGIRNGVPFEEPIKERGRAAKTYKDCVAIAEKKGGPYGILAGWADCIEKVLPEPDDSVDIDGREYLNCIGFGLSRKTGDPIFYFDEGDGPEEVPIEKVLGKNLPKKAQLWLDSYAKWRATRHQR